MKNPYDEGFEARRNGETENPYPVWSDSRAEWFKGWQAQDRHLADRDEALDSIELND